jgi:hypothetical protein
MFGPFELFIFYSYGIPLLLINLRTSYVLYRERNQQFNSTFYSIFFVCVTNESVLYVITNITSRLPAIEIFYQLIFSNWTEWTYKVSPLIFLMLYSGYMTIFGNLLLSANRFTVLWKVGLRSFGEVLIFEQIN